MFKKFIASILAIGFMTSAAAAATLYPAFNVNGDWKISNDGTYINASCSYLGTNQAKNDFIRGFEKNGEAKVDRSTWGYEKTNYGSVIVFQFYHYASGQWLWGGIVCND